MAILGNGREYDQTFKVGPLVATTTTQYLVVGQQGGDDDFTVALTNAGTTTAGTATAQTALGVVQNFPSSGSNEVNVRMFGISKVKCAASIAAGNAIEAYQGASTTTFAGHVQAFAPAAFVTATSAKIILGRALESGSTNTVISAFIIPTLITY